MFGALELLNKDSIRVEFTILGIEKTSFKNSYFPYPEEIPSYVKCVGRVPQAEVPGYYKMYNFSVLLRENKRYAQAGFPTKLVESLASGVPVITNITSDIPKYVVDGENGFLLKNNSVQELLDCFKYILSLTRDNLVEMSKNAKNSSFKNFDLQLYSALLKDYFQNLR